jgi:hypothetical protein
MKIKYNRSIIFLIFFLLIAIYQDFPLVNSFGELARSFMFFLVIPMLIYVLSHKKILISKHLSELIYYTIYLCFISVVYIAILFYKEGTFVFLKENVFIKSIKMLAYPIVSIVVYQFSYMYLSKQNRLNSLFYAVLVLQIFAIIFIVFEYIWIDLSDPFLPFIHANSWKYWRIRFLTYEESWVGTIITFLVFIPIFLANYLKKSKKRLYQTYALSVLLFVFYSFVSQSKGYIFLLLISVLPMLVSYLYQNTKTRRLLKFAVPMVIVIGGVVFFNLQQLIDNQYTSITFGTRFTSYFASLLVFVSNPLGVGWSGYLHFLPLSIKDVILNYEITSGMDMSEIRTYMVSTKNLSTKTDFFDNLIFGGVGFLFFFYRFYVLRYMTLYKQKGLHFFYLKIVYLFSVLAGFVYITFHIKYEIWFLFALIDVVLNKCIHETEAK